MSAFLARILMTGDGVPVAEYIDAGGAYVQDSGQARDFGTRALALGAAGAHGWKDDEGRMLYPFVISDEEPPRPVCKPPARRTGRRMRKHVAPEQTFAMLERWKLA